MSDDNPAPGSNHEHSKKIDELSVTEAYEAKEGSGEITCPNGCYEPVEVTRESLDAAAHLPNCDECGSDHIVSWTTVEQ